MKKYKIYCETDSKWEEVIASSEPTVCPTNVVHTVKAESVSLLSNVDRVDGVNTDLPLADLIQLRCNEVDDKTDELIANGFTFDSKQFGLSDTQRIDWIGLEVMKALMTWPHTISTLDSGTYSLAELDLPNFIGAGLGTYTAIRSGGASRRATLKAYTTKAEVDAWVDDRV